MKLQIQDSSLRLRVDEAELARLLAGERLHLQADLDRGPLLSLQVGLGESLAWRSDDGWHLQLPASAVRAYAQRLPTREALSWPLAARLRLDFEVDVRDSRKQRGRPL